MQAVIELQGVHKSFEGRKVLDGLTLSVAKGEIMVVIGGSGSGKTVMLKHVVGLLRPDTGVIRVARVEIPKATPGELAQVRRKIGFLFQEGALLDSLSVYENLALPLREHTDLTEREIQGQVGSALSAVGLSGCELEIPANLSKGVKKKVALARTLINNPEIILYDEPTSGLDPILAATINDLIIEMQHSLGVTSLMVTHDLNSAFKVANRIAMLHQGKIIKVGSPEEIQGSEDPQVREFIWTAFGTTLPGEP
jgi:phospholipid/cholesterol/gamma-HCH transport system ATP-binding protein